MARKKTNPEPEEGQEPIIPAEDALAGEPGPAPVEDTLADAALPDGEDGDVPADSDPSIGEPTPIGAVGRRLAPRSERERVLTIDPRAEVQTQEDLEDIVWHELQNANRTRHALTGTLDSVERTDNGMTVAIVRYKGFKVMIPLKEMMVHTGPVPSGGVDFNLWVD